MFLAFFFLGSLGACEGCMYMIFSCIDLELLCLPYINTDRGRSNGGEAEDALRGRPTPRTQGLAAAAVSPKCVTGPARRTQWTLSTPWVAPPASRSRVRPPLPRRKALWSGCGGSPAVGGARQTRPAMRPSRKCQLAQTTEILAAGQMCV